jgi:hypothetical protein
MPTCCYAMTVDTEEEWDWDRGWPTTAPSVANVRLLPRFQELCSRWGVATTYFTNKAVLDDPQARQVVLDLAAAPGVEIGMHIHPWNTPPLDPGEPVVERQSFLHNLPADRIRAKLEATYRTFLEHGLRPTSFRGGRYSSGGVIHEFLRDRGFWADASVVPYTSWPGDGAPDYRTRTRDPIRLPPRTAGELPLWEVPLTLGFTRGPERIWRRAFEALESPALRRLRLIGLSDRLGLVRRIWLNFEDTPAPRMLGLLERLRREPPPCVVLTIHSSSFLVGGNPYTPTPQAQDRLFDRFETIFRRLAAWPEFRPATITDLARSLEDSHHARSRTEPAR